VATLIHRASAIANAYKYSDKYWLIFLISWFDTTWFGIPRIIIILNKHYSRKSKAPHIFTKNLQ